ncbi:uncharacterized protein I206_105600 [Kwoniella pini CBS 10737]|uniref:Uncharacterized protein n=1 Tax=Kwoniella pini CBS 10737 TaxID=1296096 RepID=A0A1B9I3X1_9TREE|nr:uncharacterized protein I206_03500 [Kwoniella pini CBS 10737]OCF50181.1 hypothetical protein I206_03500 [Kwoniella pini CBS 10737]
MSGRKYVLLFPEEQPSATFSSARLSSRHQLLNESDSVIDNSLSLVRVNQLFDTSGQSSSPDAIEPVHNQAQEIAKWWEIISERCHGTTVTDLESVMQILRDDGTFSGTLDREYVEKKIIRHVELFKGNHPLTRALAFSVNTENKISQADRLLDYNNLFNHCNKIEEISLISDCHRERYRQLYHGNVQQLARKYGWRTEPPSDGRPLIYTEMTVDGQEVSYNDTIDPFFDIPNIREYTKENMQKSHLALLDKWMAERDPSNNPMSAADKAKMIKREVESVNKSWESSVKQWDQQARTLTDNDIEKRLKFNNSPLAIADGIGTLITESTLYPEDEKKVDLEAWKAEKNASKEAYTLSLKDFSQRTATRCSLQKELEKKYHVKEETKPHSRWRERLSETLSTLIPRKSQTSESTQMELVPYSGSS